MDTGTIFIWTALLLTIGAVIFSILFLKLRDPTFQLIAILCTVFDVLVITFAYILLTSYFLNSNFDIHYVWEHSGENMETYLKFSAVWAGQEGSILLWVWIVLIPLGIEEFIQYNKRRKMAISSDFDDDYASDFRENENLNSDLYDWTRIIVMMVALVFMILLVVKDPFVATHTYDVTYQSGGTGTIDPADFPAGRGLNPMLRNFWMSIHPPLLFLGYALISIPFGASLAYSITGDRRWTSISLQWSRLSWLFLTLGLGIGALWAYIAIGWGGYWYWDAVEVGGLVPWITLTALLHTQLRNQKKNEYGIITPILATLTFVLVIFATFITRSGLWTSVHAWSETEVGQILLATMIITLVMSSIIILRSFIIRHSQKIREDDYYKYFPDNWDSYLMYGTFIIFAFLSLITFIGLIATMKTPNPDFYETRLAPVIFIMLLFLSICLAWRFFGKDNIMHIVMWTTIAGLACAILFPRYVFPGEPTSFYGSINTHQINGFLLPFVLLVIFASLYKIYRQLRLKSLRKKLYAISPHIIHLGVAFIVISYGMSQTMVEEGVREISEGDVLEVSDYQIKFVDLTIEEDTGDLDSNEFWDTWFVTVELYKDNKLIEKGKMDIVYSYNYDNTGRRVYNMIMTSEVFVAKMPFEDVFISFKGINDNTIELTVQVIPMMQILWSGMWLFTIGIIIRIAIGYFPRKKDLEMEKEVVQSRISRRPARREIPKRVSRPKKDDDEYEKMLEEELKNL